MSYQSDTSEEPEITENSDSASDEDSRNIQSSTSVESSTSSESSADTTDSSDTENSESSNSVEESEDTQVDDSSSEELPVAPKDKKLFQKPQTTHPIIKGTKKLPVKPVATILESYPGETTISRAYLDQASQLVAKEYSMVPFADNLIRSGVNYKLYHSRYYMNLNTNAKNISQELTL